jgi:peptidoglycan hydrolase CwlO-like protein
MWENKHLKAIPKAEVDKDGQEVVEVGAHQKGIVEELEKAHIYIEQLNAKNKELEAQNNELNLKHKSLEERISKLEALINNKPK